MKKLSIAVLMFLIIISCTKISQNPLTDYTFGGGVFILNEGNFRAGNGSLSFYSYDSLKIYNDLFFSTNGRHLGDVPNSMMLKNDKAYLVINNSGKIEVIDATSLVSKATITGLNSPRDMAVVSDTRAYVSSIYSDSVAIINLTNNSISGYINLRRSSESIIVSGNKAYISNWFGGKEIMVVNTLTNRVVDSIKVGVEPESMVLDKDQKLWVLCNGGWQRENVAEIDVINLSTNHIDKKYAFPGLENSPTSLVIDGAGKTIFYLDGGVKQMDISSSDLPSTPLIPESGSYFYKLAVNPINSDIFVTDAVDFVQRGYVSIYKNNGDFVLKEKADINPGFMCFKLKINP